MSYFSREPRSRRQIVLILLVLSVVGAAINMPISVQFLKSRTEQPKVPSVANIRGAEAAALGWPYATPHETEWPAPDYRSEFRSFGYRRFQIAASYEPRQNSHSMEYELIGWPLPVLERVQMWWPWNDPKWATSAEPDPALRLHWTGVILNPLIFTGIMWMVLFAWVDFVRWIVRRHRRRMGRCMDCGYVLDRTATTDRCPECGSDVKSEVRTSTRQAAS